jgi:hypothetical protein
MRLTEPRVPALDPETMPEGLDKMQSDFRQRRDLDYARRML